MKHIILEVNSEQEVFPMETGQNGGTQNDERSAFLLVSNQKRSRKRVPSLETSMQTFKLTQFSHVPPNSAWTTGNFAQISD